MVLPASGSWPIEFWNQDPRRTLFTLARYKFVAKILDGRENVLEVGCADAFGTRLVQQTVKKVAATDIDPTFVEDVKERINPNWPLDVFVHDLLAGPVPGEFDAAYALDVLEHISPQRERSFLDNMVASISETGVLIIGMPSFKVAEIRIAAKQSRACQLQNRDGT